MTTHDDKPKVSTGKRILQIVLPLLAIAAGVAVFQAMMATKPEPPKAPPRPEGALVEVATAKTVNERLTVSAVGRARPSQTGKLAPEVGGRIVEVHPGLIKGGTLKQGDLAFKIDPKDYELAARTARARVAQARYELKVEGGRQTVAKQEWKLLDTSVPTTDAGRALALREPHKELAEANLASAMADLARAQRQVEKTEVRVPFDAYVSEEAVEEGLLAPAGAQLAELVGTDTFWIEAAIPIVKLSTFAVPGVGGVGAEDGARVDVIMAGGAGQEHRFEGRVVRLLGELDELGVQARILVAVDDPMRLQTPGLPLFVGAFVDLEIEGREVEDVVEIPAVALRGEDEAYVITAANALEIRELSVVWRDRDRVLVDGGVKAGDRLVVSRLAQPVPGMKVRVQGEAPPVVAAGQDAPEAPPAVGDADGESEAMSP